MIGSKWKHGIIPSLLINGSIGTIYCWSLLAAEIEKTNLGENSISWVFSLSIFLMGISAALLGPVVEKYIKSSVFISAICFGLGMIISGFAIKLESIGLFYLGYGALVGIGVGIGYLAPIKTLILWFGKRKGLGVGLGIMTFGLAAILAAPGFSYFLINYDLTTLFIFHGIIYLLFMLIAARLIKKPDGSTAYSGKLTWSIYKRRMLDAVKVPGLWVYWIILFLNTTAGLAIISHEQYFFSATDIVSGMGFCLSMCAIFNSAGRFGVAWVSDYVFNHHKLFGIILVISVIACTFGFMIPTSIPFTVLICNLCYGAMYSLLPCAISDRYGNDRIGEIHGILLSAWAISGVIGNQLSGLAVTLPISTHQTLILMAGVLYAIGLYFSVRLWELPESEKSNQKITFQKPPNS